MRRIVTTGVLVGVLIGVPAGSARAQDELVESCAGSVPTANVPSEARAQFRYLCAQVVNVLTTVQPGIGIAFSGGNPVLGTGTTLGRRLGFMPRFSVTARANVALVDVPDLFGEYPSRIDDTFPELGAIQTVGTPIGSLQGDVAIGLFNGLSLGPMVGGLGSIDLLGSVAFLPTIDEVGLSRSIMNYGAGARVGLLRQGTLVPGISISGMYRRMGAVAFGDVNDPVDPDPGEFATNLETLSVRGVISKGILIFDLAVGAGYDRYSSDLAARWVLTCETEECRDATGLQSVRLEGQVDGELSSAAWNVFGNVALNLLMLNLVAEVGYQNPIDALTAEDFQDPSLPDRPLTFEDLDGGRLFGSIGLRISL